MRGCGGMPANPMASRVRVKIMYTAAQAIHRDWIDLLGDYILVKVSWDLGGVHIWLCLLVPEVVKFVCTANIRFTRLCIGIESVGKKKKWRLTTATWTMISWWLEPVLPSVYSLFPRHTSFICADSSRVV